MVEKHCAHGKKGAGAMADRDKSRIFVEQKAQY